MSTEKFEVPSAERDAEVSFSYAPDTGYASSLVSWQPGNGTWYRVLFTPLFGDPLRESGFGDGANAFLVTWVIPGELCQSHIFNDGGGFLHYSYVHEKLCFKRGSAVDASELTRIIGLFLGREVGLCTDEHGRHTD